MIYFQENVTGNISKETIDTSKQEWFTNSVKIIRWCFLPVIIVGTVTNIINIAIFSKKKMRHQSTGNLLLGLAFADLGLMYFQVSI